jgi:hypothetical protein
MAETKGVDQLLAVDLLHLCWSFPALECTLSRYQIILLFHHGGGRNDVCCNQSI